MLYLLEVLHCQSPALGISELPPNGGLIESLTDCEDGGLGAVFDIELAEQ